MDVERSPNLSPANGIQYANYPAGLSPVAPPPGKRKREGPLLHRIVQFINDETTFFRAHLAAFTFIPLIFSGIFYASNGRYHVGYLDSMFLCYSAMTVTGLSTVNLSTITVWQQVILYFLMAIGDITIVSWVMVLIRKRFFKTHCEYTIAKRKRSTINSKLKSKNSFMQTISGPIASFKQREPTPRQPVKSRTTSDDKSGSSGNPQFNLVGPTPGVTRANTTLYEDQIGEREAEGRISSDGSPMLPDATFSSSPKSATTGLPSQEDLHNHEVLPTAGNGKITIPNTEQKVTQQTLLSPKSILSPHSMFSSERSGSIPGEAARSPPAIDFAASTNVSPRSYRNMFNLRDRRGIPHLRRQPTIISNRSFQPPTLPNSPYSHHTNQTAGTHETHASNKYEGMGGFPGPAHLLQNVIKITAPHAYGHMERNLRKLDRKLTMMPSMQTIEATNVPWLKKLDALVVGRNSDFRTETLTDDQLEEVGGAEYRALRLLSYLVPAYFIVFQLISVLLFLPWLTVDHKYDSVFVNQPRLVGKPWFGFFQVMGAYTGGGLSLVDLGMVPFDDAYLMIAALALVILAGNHALPIFLRFLIWVSSVFIPKDAEAQEALAFLLDHPRRCFLYLFPSHQTWFLVICLVVFSIVEWVGFLVLNIGLEAFEAIPTTPRVVAGLFQGLAARASGFSIVPLASLAPSLQFLYVVMMYIAVYPVALSIRSTNVYEERSLGVFETPPDDEDEEPADLTKIQSHKERVGKYVQWHLRRQMSIDIWWLVWAVFIVAIIERNNLLDEDKKWFDLFRVLFELVSAFGGIGLSLGFPTENYSFAGAMSPLSKLVVIIIMVRGRHRGLPVAVDRAVLLPSELVTNSGHGPSSNTATAPANMGQNGNNLSDVKEKGNTEDFKLEHPDPTPNPTQPPPQLVIET